MSDSMSQRLFLLLIFALPAMLSLLVIVPVALAGVARWRRTLLVVSLIALALLALEFWVLGAPFLTMTYYTTGMQFDNTLWMWAFSSGVCFVMVTMVGAFLALILAARLHARRWFNAIVMATIISAVAGSLAYGTMSTNGPYMFAPFLNSGLANAIYFTPLYHLIIWALAGLTIVVQLLYALFGPREPQGAPVAPASANDATLP